MIEINEKLFHLTTANTSYVFTIGNNGELLHLFYGKALSITGNGRNALMQKWSNQNGCSVANDEADKKLCPDDEKYEFPTFGKGDHRTPAIVLRNADGCETSEFVYEGYEVMSLEGASEYFAASGMPHSYMEGEGGRADNALKLTLKEKHSDIKVELLYCVYEQADVITRSARVINNTDCTVEIKAIASLSLDMDADVARVTSFHGDWGREMERCDVMLTGGRFVSESRSGNSSNHANPFVMISEPGATETSGDVFAMNLVYSGNHRESVEMGGHAKMRFMTGINPDLFSWQLESGKDFYTPEAVLTFSDAGYRGISKNMHEFVRENIVRGEWKKKERPILINSWEAAYFKISERKLLGLAEEAAKLGMELFVMDDGWFGKRDDDTSSLGDWTDNKSKLPGGISGLSKKIKAMGLMFGIWVEPEMVNADSELFRSHPDWVIRHPERHHAEGRNQMILDMSNVAVQNYIIEAMSDVFARSECDYVKWDMNRNFSDVFRANVLPEHQAETCHAYMLGLYRVMKTLTDEFPNILFEGCASGGNRFDLGILSYFPQIWASDDTDAIARCSIQNGYSYGYPQSTWSAHVSASPNHQTLRVTSLETRYAVASMGVFGYELNLCDLSEEQKKEIKDEVEIYKRNRSTLQFGDFYRLGGSVTENTFDKYQGGFLSTRLDSTVTRNIVVSKDKSKAVGYIVNGLVHPNYSHTSFRCTGLKEDKLYRFTNRILKYDVRRMGDLVNTMAPIHIRQDGVLHDLLAKFVKLDGETEDYIVSGALLNSAGINLAQTYVGTGYGENTRLFSDFEARMYEVYEIE